MEPYTDWALYAPYIQALAVRKNEIQPLLDKHIQALATDVVGNGYVDIILERESAIKLIEASTRLGIAVTELTPWCNCTPENRIKYHCPHGGGGPSYAESSYFSECYQYHEWSLSEEQGFDNAMFGQDFLRFVGSANARAVDYIANQMVCEPFYSPCLCPGLWMLVPDDWLCPVFREHR